MSQNPLQISAFALKLGLKGLLADSRKTPGFKSNGVIVQKFMVEGRIYPQRFHESLRLPPVRRSAKE
jgi:hypothetical protein